MPAAPTNLPRLAHARVLGLAVGVSCALRLAAEASFDLDAFDSAELALVAVTRGLGHPPGQPLHTLLGWLVTRLPGAPLAWLTWLSIAPLAVATAVAVTRDVHADQPWTLALRAAVSFTVVSLPAVRAVACRVEVYPLAASCACASVWLAAARTARTDFFSGVFTGLAAATNPVIAVQSVGALAVAWRGAARERWRLVARMGTGALLGLAPYAYLAFGTDRADRTLVWGAPRTLAAWVAELTAADFHANVTGAPHDRLTALGHVLVDQTRSGTLAVVAAALVFLAVGTRTSDSLRRGLALALAAVVGVAMIAANVPYLSRNPDYGGYLLVPVVLAAEILARANVVRRAPIALATAMSAVVAVVTAVRERPVGVVRALAYEMLTSAPPDAVVVTGNDHLLFPAMYLQRVENVRRDVAVINPGWASASWAWALVRAKRPDLDVNLSRGLGGTLRLALAIASRGRARAVLSDSLPWLQHVTAGGVCVHGVLWSSIEGCSAMQRSFERTTRLLDAWSHRARSDSWDARIVLYTALSLGDGAAAVRCTSMAEHLYDAGLGRNDPRRPVLPCDGRTTAIQPNPGLLEITPESLHRAARALRAPEATSP